MVHEKAFHRLVVNSYWSIGFIRGVNRGGDSASGTTAREGM